MLTQHWCLIVIETHSLWLGGQKCQLKVLAGQETLKGLQNKVFLILFVEAREHPWLVTILHLLLSFSYDLFICMLEIKCCSVAWDSLWLSWIIFLSGILNLIIPTKTLFPYKASFTHGTKTWTYLIRCIIKLAITPNVINSDLTVINFQGFSMLSSKTWFMQNEYQKVRWWAEC